MKNYKFNVDKYLDLKNPINLEKARQNKKPPKYLNSI
jgi:hypothetical protein